MADGHRSCLDPGACEDPRNLMTPAEFVAWLELYLAPPRPAAIEGGLTEAGRTTIVEAQRRRRERERAQAAGA